MYDELFEKRGLSLDRLRALVEVADAGGIANAIGDDPVRQSQYSRQLKELDQFFGVELTCRKGRSLTLTPAGQSLAVVVRETFATLCDVRNKFVGAPVSVTVGAGEALHHWILTDAAGKLRAEFPRVIINLVNRKTNSVVDALSERSIDFGLVRSTAVPETLHSRNVGRLEYRLFIPLSLLPKLQAKNPALLLTKVPLAMLEGKGDYTQGIQNIADRMQIQLNISLVCTTLPQICSAVRSGAYAGILPALAAPELPVERFVAFDLPQFKLLRRPLSLCWHPRLFVVRDGVEKLAESLGDSIEKLLKGRAEGKGTSVK